MITLNIAVDEQKMPLGVEEGLNIGVLGRHSHCVIAFVRSERVF